MQVTYAPDRLLWLQKKNPKTPNLSPMLESRWHRFWDLPCISMVLQAQMTQILQFQRFFPSILLKSCNQNPLKKKKKKKKRGKKKLESWPILLVKSICPWKTGSPLHWTSEFLICTMDRFCDGKTSNVASSPRRLSGPLRVVELGGPTDDKVDACTHDSKCHSTILDSSVVQIESSSISLSIP